MTSFRRPSRLLAIPLLLTAALLAGASRLTGPARTQSDADDVKATMVAMWAAIEAGNVDLYASYVHPDFTQFGENDTYLAAGKALEVRSIADYVKRASNVHTEMHDPRVTVRGTVAWVTYYWTDAGYSSGARFTSRGKSTRIFVKENGRWLCIHGHYTAVP
jgi:ketosteroid isomerase-like protein